jgi:cyanophycinase-like exopeptidase
MSKTLILLLLAASSGTLAKPPSAELFLAGGALRTCSELAPRACESPPDRADRRLPAEYRVDDGGLSRALDPLLWQDRADAPDRATLAAMLASARRDGDWSLDDIEARLAAYCPTPNCDDGGPTSPWQRLLDDERAAILSALEVPQIVEGLRREERAMLAHSRDQAGVEVLRAFVAAAAARAPGRIPRIAVVTASALDPFDPVDFYLDAFRELGADAEWWPVDAALNAAVFEQDRCDGLDSLRRERMKLSGRDRIYPKLGAQQWRACLDPDSITRVPERVQGVFFAGGDQWRHRQAFFDGHDRPNAWLVAMLREHEAGSLVVGGTSAGTAVQSGVAMVSNGTSAEALVSGALARLPMAPGCSRAGRCAAGLAEDSLTFWAAGGLGLLPGWTIDTHFSERGRELRLLVLMHAAKVDFALGVDETSAIHVLRRGGDTHFEALGAQGGWLFERLPSDGDGALEARVHYLAPGHRFALVEGVLRPVNGSATQAKPADGGKLARDALAPGALRGAAQKAWHGDTPLKLSAATGCALLSRTDNSRAFPGNGAASVTALHLRYQPDCKKGDGGS